MERPGPDIEEQIKADPPNQMTFGGWDASGEWHDPEDVIKVVYVDQPDEGVGYTENVHSLDEHRAALWVRLNAPDDVA
jgi:hypothetical protein